MRNGLVSGQGSDAIPIIPVTTAAYQDWRRTQTEPHQRWLDTTEFTAESGQSALLPDEQQRLAAVIVGVDAEGSRLWSLAALPGALPAGDYYLDADWDAGARRDAALGWALACYRFGRYKEIKPARARLAVDADLDELTRIADATMLVRDLINTPAEHMMPENLADAMNELAEEFDARIQHTVGDELIEHNYPVIHLVGRASTHPPRLLDLRWSPPDHSDPAELARLTLVGKGVCFDSGGLDLKPANSMRLMKKDMGGAAHAIGLARLVMASGLPVRLRLLVAAVENAVSANSFRPGDVVRSRQGKTIEVDNTDAEGRLILCDALTEAASEQPDLIIDFATLTGAARVALGTEVPALFCNSDALAEQLQRAAADAADPLWRLPLHRPYRSLLDSPVADIVNSSPSPFGGAITAALFLQDFVPDDIAWAHFDLMAWNNRARPGRPEGGEAMAVRAVFECLRRRYAG